MSHSLFSITGDDLLAYNWQVDLSLNPRKDCRSYCETFAIKAREFEQAGDKLGLNVYRFLSCIASFHANYGSDINPYGPFFRNADGSRALSPDDLSEPDLEAIQSVFRQVVDAEFRARLADILWMLKKDHKAARVAVEAFIEAAEQNYSPESWPPFVQRLDRAASICARKGFEAEKAMVVERVEAAIARIEDPLKCGFLCSRLMGILRRLDSGDPAYFAGFSEQIALNFSAANMWNFALEYWQTAESWHRARKDELEVRRAALEAAECLVSRAKWEAAKAPPQNGAAAHWMGQALEALRRSKADKGRVKEVHREFLNFQKLALDQLRPLEHDLDSDPEVADKKEAAQHAARNFVAGKSFEDAMVRFASIAVPTSVLQLTAIQNELSRESVWDKIVGASRLDSEGKVTDSIPASGSADDSVEREAFRKRLVQLASQVWWPVTVDWQIEPARQQIAGEHPVRFRDLAFLVENNSFIRPGRESIFLKGIQAGFFGDWLLAMHLLIPQLEDSLRYILQQREGIASKLMNGIQHDRDTNDLLWDPEIENVLGGDILFDLRGILIERFGCNMRNEMAHGLMSEGGFYRPESPLLWWLVIHLCWIGLARSNEQSEDDG